MAPGRKPRRGGALSRSWLGPGGSRSSLRALSASADLRGTPVFCSWSGGKDSALALHEAQRAGAEPRLLVSMMIESGERSRSHGLSREVLAAQAEAVGLPIEFGAASWSGYEAELIRVL